MCCQKDFNRSPGFHLIPSPGAVEIGEIWKCEDRLRDINQERSVA